MRGNVCRARRPSRGRARLIFRVRDGLGRRLNLGDDRALFIRSAKSSPAGKLFSRNASIVQVPADAGLADPVRVGQDALRRSVPGVLQVH